MFEAYIPLEVIREIEIHFANHAEKKLEAMGLLAGRVYNYNKKDYVVVEEYLTGVLKASSVSVKFNENTLGSISGRVGNRIIVGWVHSHPGYGCFMSSTDIKTQKSYFSKPFNIAGVFDPTKKEGEEMLKRFYKLEDDNYREIPFAIFKK
jgi:proteasome lid subunit RPN8/RPN11